MPDPIGPCVTCGEGDFPPECPESKRPCGHHCNCSWEQDYCHWCGREFGDEIDEELAQMIEAERALDA